MDLRYNGREVTHRYSQIEYSQAVGGVIFWGSLAWYYSRYFKVNKSIPLFAAFTVGSYFAA